MWMTHSARSSRTSKVLESPLSSPLMADAAAGRPQRLAVPLPGAACDKSEAAPVSARTAPGSEAAPPGPGFSPQQHRPSPLPVSVAWRQESATRTHSARMMRSNSEGGMSRADSRTSESRTGNAVAPSGARATPARSQRACGSPVELCERQPQLLWFDDRRRASACGSAAGGGSASGRAGGRRPSSAAPSAATTPRSVVSRSLSESVSVTPMATPRCSRGSKPKDQSYSKAKDQSLKQFMKADALIQWYMGEGSADESGKEALRGRAQPSQPRRISRTSSAISLCSTSGTDLHGEVSSLVDELEAARARAVTDGGRPPRAVEAAAAALEPLLRLREVGATCDLSAMPWLPQLLDVFRSVLHSALDGSLDGSRDEEGEGADAAAQFAMLVSAADSFGLPVPLAEAFGTEDCEVSFTSDSASDGTAGAAKAAELQSELELLQRRVREQDAQLSAAFHTEAELRRSCEAMRRERDELRLKACALEAAAAVSSHSGAAEVARGEQAGSELLQRLAELEAENRAFRAQEADAEDRLATLMGFVEAAVQADAAVPARQRPSAKQGGSPRRPRSRTPSASPKKAGRAEKATQESETAPRAG